MSKLNSRLKEIEVVGLIPSIPYQRAKKCAREICRCYPQKFSKPKFRGLLEFDWDEYITKQRRKYGGQLWALLRPVAVYIDKQFLGSDEDLVDMINKRFVFSLPSGGAFYETAMLEDYAKYLEKTELYSDILPKTCYYFKCLCTGDEKPERCYKGTRIHRIAKTGWIQGGDNEFITGGGGKSIHGEFGDESYCISHDRRGVLSMANHGKHTNGSQFIVTLQPTVWMDRYYVAFGQVVEGVEVLRAIESVREVYEEPTQRITISDCGILYEPTSQVYRDRIRPFQSEEARRKMRAVRRKNEEEVGELEEPRLAAEVCDVRDLDSDMHVCRYLRGLYYLFNARAKVMEPDPEEVQVAKHILEILLDNVVMDVGRKVMEEIMERVEATAFDVQEMVQEIVKDVVHRAVIHREVETATEVVDDVIARAVEIVQRMMEERMSGSMGWEEGGAAEEPPADEVPAEEAPSEETPAEETPADETPAEEMPADETPADKTPAEETTIGEQPGGDAPTIETPAGEAPVDELPAEEAPAADEAPAEVVEETTEVEMNNMDMTEVEPTVIPETENIEVEPIADTQADPIQEDV